jgi:hypothetical protein
MVCKLFLEEGKYLDIETQELKNLMCVEIAYTPEGINVGWTEFESIDECMEEWGLERVPEPEEEEELLKLINSQEPSLN